MVQYPHFEDVEALPHGKEFPSKKWQYEFKYLFDQPDMNARQARWLSFLSEYHFELKHIKEKENKVVDALSWWTHMIYEVTLSQTNADLHEKIITTNKVDRSMWKSSRRSKRIDCFNNRRNTRWMTLDYYGPRIDCMFQMEGTFGPTSSHNFIGHHTWGNWDIKRWYMPSRDIFYGLR